MDFPKTSPMEIDPEAGNGAEYEETKLLGGYSGRDSVKLVYLLRLLKEQLHWSIYSIFLHSVIIFLCLYLLRSESSKTDETRPLTGRSWCKSRRTSWPTNMLMPAQLLFSPLSRTKLARSMQLMGTTLLSTAHHQQTMMRLGCTCSNVRAEAHHRVCQSLAITLTSIQHLHSMQLTTSSRGQRSPRTQT